MQKNAEPIREAVLNLESHHKLEDLEKVAKVLRERFKIDCFQMHIHRDEGLKGADGKIEKMNYHAHILVDWQDKETGKTLKLTRLDFSKIQTAVSEALGMQRGEFKSNTNRERLEIVEFKNQQEEIKNKALQQQNAELEQKKNEVIARIRKIPQFREAKELEEYLNDFTELGSGRFSALELYEGFSEEDLSKAFVRYSYEIQEMQEEIDRIEH